MSLRQVPNLICLVRLALVIPIAWTLTHDDPGTTLWLFAIAAVSDGADGFLAKRFGWQTDIGAILDPLADKVLLVTVFITLAFLGLVPIWLVWITVGRDLIIVGGALAYRLRLGPMKIAPTISSKINTVCQLSFVLLIIGRQAFAWPAGWPMAGLVQGMGALVFVMAFVSGLDYVITYGTRARRALAQSRRA